MKLYENNKKPVISIISSTFNAVNDLEKTIRSIKSQTYKNIQWIIIDGNSKDGTVELIKKNEDCIDFWLSENDKGIYDAWNKAIEHIKGQWVFFLGAGDLLYSNNVLSDISSNLSNAYPKFNLVYGKVIVLDDDNKIITEYGKSWNVLRDSWESIRLSLPPHSGCFLHTSFFKEKKYSFPVNLKIAGDSHILITAITEKEPLFIPMYINKMLFGGVSTSGESLLQIIKELKQINKEFDLKPPSHIYYWNLCTIYLKAFFNIILPERIHKVFYNNYLKIKFKLKNSLK